MKKLTVQEQLRAAMTCAEYAIVEAVLNGLKDKTLVEDLELRLLAKLKFPNLVIRDEDPLINFYLDAFSPFLFLSKKRMEDPFYDSFLG